jgi:hypothetical protein
MLTLEKAAEYAARLAGKTHNGSEPAGIIYPGVFGTAADSATGAIRASALKQFGFLEGKLDAITATALARQLAVTEGTERQPILQRACITPPLFNTLFKTYRGDRVSLAKLKQKAGEERVHPDNLERCVTTFADSVVYAGLASRDGDEITLVTASPTAIIPNDEIPVEDSPSRPADASVNDELGSTIGLGAVQETDAEDLHDKRAATEDGSARRTIRDNPGSARSVVQVNFELDSSFDTDKLARQLDLLRQYGVI